MKKLFKILAGLVVLGFVLIVALVVILPMVIEPNDFKPQIIEVVKQQTGRDLTIDGDIGLSVFPRVGLQLGKTELSNAAGFSGETFASTNAVNIQVALMPLLKKKVRMDEVVVDGLQLNLQRDASGKTNWDDLAGKEKGTAGGDDKAKPASSANQPKLEEIYIGGVNIRDANISWKDETKGDAYQISKFNLTSGPIVPGDPVDIDLMTAFSSEQHQANGDLNFAGELLLAEDVSQLSVNGLQFGVNVDAKKELPGKHSINLGAKQFVFAAKNDGEISINGLQLGVGVNATDVVPGKIDLKADSDAILFKLKDMIVDPTRLNLVVDYDLKEPAIKGTAKLYTAMALKLASQLFVLKEMKADVSAEGKALNDQKVDVKLQSSAFETDLKKQTLRIDDMVLNSLGLNIKGQVSGTSILQDSRTVNGKLNIAKFNARDLLKTLGGEVPETADPKVLTQVQAGFDLAMKPNALHLSSLNAQLDDTQIKGDFALVDLKKQAMDFNLNIDTIDLDRYLPPESKAAATKSAGGKAGPANQSSGNEEIFPVETLKKINAKGIARIGKLKVKNVRASDIVVELKAKEGWMKVEPKASLYKGKVDGTFVVNVKKKQPIVKAKSNLKGVQIEPLLKDLTGDAKLAGKTHLNFDVKSRGNTQNALKKALGGEASFRFTDGAIIGVNIAKVIRDGSARLEGKSVSNSAASEKTDFSQLSGTAKINKGVINNKDFTMKSPLLRVNGDGKVNLPGENVNYLVKASVVGSLQGQGGQDLSKLQGLTIPIRIKGPFDDLSYTPDLSEALKGQAKQKIDEKKQELQDKAKDKLKDKLKGLF